MELKCIWKRKFDSEFWKWFGLRDRIVGELSGFVLDKEVIRSFVDEFGYLKGVFLMGLDMLDIGWKCEDKEGVKREFDSWWEE